MSAPAQPPLAVSIARLVLLVIGMGAVCGAVLLGVLTPLGGNEYSLDDIPVHVTENAAGFGRAYDATASVELGQLSLGTRAALASGPFLLLVGVAVGSRILDSLLKEVSEGRPFTAVNGRRLHTLGLLLLAWALVVPQLNELGRVTALRDHANGFTVHVEWVPLVAGGIAFAMASAFERGLRLEDDVEGLV